MARLSQIVLSFFLTEIQLPIGYVKNSNFFQAKKLYLKLKYVMCSAALTISLITKHEKHLWRSVNLSKVVG